jgi:hypothetical protein
VKVANLVANIYICLMPEKAAERLSEMEGQRIAPTEAMWPDPTDGPWLLRLRWQILGGRIECVGVEIHSLSPDAATPDRRLPGDRGRVVTTTLLRDIRIADRIRAGRDRQGVFASRSRALGGSVPPPEVFTNRGRANPRTAPKRLVDVAKLYKAAKDGRPRMAVAQGLNISPSQAGNLIVRARRAGLLPVTSPGVPNAGPSTRR